MPWDFWNMTPAELRLRVDARLRQDEHEWRRTATLARWVMSAWIGKDTPSIDALLGHEHEV